MRIVSSVEHQNRPEILTANEPRFQFATDYKTILLQESERTLEKERQRIQAMTIVATIALNLFSFGVLDTFPKAQYLKIIRRYMQDPINLAPLSLSGFAISRISSRTFRFDLSILLRLVSSFEWSPSPNLIQQERFLRQSFPHIFDDIRKFRHQ
jgi:hypothetical protein